jgi:hypothetical protein
MTTSRPAAWFISRAISDERDGRGHRRAAAVAREAHRLPGLESTEHRLGRVEPQLHVSRRQQAHDRTSGGDEIADDVIRVVHAPGCRRLDGALPESPVRLRERFARRFRIAFGGADLVGPAHREVHGRDTRLELCHASLVAAQFRAHVVERCAADESGFIQRLLTLEIGGGEITRRDRLPELLIDRLNLGRALSCLQILEARLRRLKLLLGLPALGQLVLLLEAEERRAGFNLIAALYRELLQRAGEGCTDAHVLALDIALQRLILRRAAPGRE